MLPTPNTAAHLNPTATAPFTSSASSTTIAAPIVRSLSNSDNAALLRLDTISIANQFLKAVTDGDIDLAGKSMLNGASVNLTNSDGTTALAIAAKNGDLDMMEVLLKAGADANGLPKTAIRSLVEKVSRDRSVMAVPLGLAIAGAVLGVTSIGGPAIVVGAFGLIVGVDKIAIATMPSCRTPLIMAAQHGRTEAVQVLLRAGATIDYIDSNRQTALKKAVEHGHADTVNVLLAANARTDIEDNDGYLPLMFAAMNGHTDILGALLKKGAKVDYADEHGRTALIHAAENNKTETVKALLEKGAKVDHSASYTTSGEPGEFIDNGTALIFAAKNGHIGPIQELLKAGADVRLTPYKGYDALSTAKSKGYDEAAQILRAAYIKALD